ncbi:MULTISPECIES: TRAP transporter substrate-binding protein DctP [Dethiosulfovibrio]|uniref:TRAP transporter substrate-binding protein DctP n=2 Tax=Dethiosulfovibrio TaxID=47054 RepID=A0ABS9EJE1_9BACT|nr:MULTISPECIES: TRAP transporter substrate-binding protein DctP [Dethiosulfovibrio]MCF4112858.1 TRAP transporter substrate-binding protein DctP [Dethiosulfovibrio russensis]MCF4141322.1 TRAP transporter substrate-binding protein DctP [Dethiosulfovibrio marinus]MCF4145652.1 TRAP transporter substrate-binding protein DctP [Dethiosulfovibrio acidaminovorans]
MRKGFLAAALLGIMATVFCTTAIPGMAEAKGDKFKVAGISAPEYRGTKSLYAIKDKFEAATDGKIELDVFPANQLGDYTQVFEEIRRGSIEMGLIFLPSQFDVMLEVGSLPFLASTGEEMKKQLSPGSVVYDIIDKSLDKLGVKLLRLYGDGFIGVGIAKKPSNPTDPSADKDALIRVAPVAVYKETAEDMGFRTTNIPYADTYSAIQTGVCDGWIGGSSQINYLSFRDVIDYYIPYNCLFDQTAYIINKKLWESMKPEEQKALLDAVNVEADKSFADSTIEDLEFQKKLEEAGVEIIEVSDEERAALAEHIRATTWPKLAKTYGEETLEKIKKDL